MLDANHRSLIDRPDSRLTDELVLHYLSEGLWRDQRIDSYLWDAAQQRPEHVGLIGYDTASGGRREVTYREYADLVRDLAAGLHTLGIRAGDAVSVMMPNVAEFALSIFAVSRLGAVYTGIPPAYGLREVSFMLRRTRSRVLIVMHRFRGQDYIDFVRALIEAGTGVEHVIVLDPHGSLPATVRPAWLTFDEVLALGQGADLPGASAAASLAHVGVHLGDDRRGEGGHEYPSDPRRRAPAVDRPRRARPGW